jgi:nitroreductase
MERVDLFETIDTLRAMRRLKPDPVPIELLRRILRAGTMAPSGQNTQPWAFIVVQDAPTKQFIQERYHRAMMSRLGRTLVKHASDNSMPAKNVRAAVYLAEHFHEVPVLLLVCGMRDWPIAVPPEHRVGKAPPSYASVYPCIQNILLACRGLGLGASLTTAHMIFHDELATHLGVPDSHGIVAILPIGYPRGKFGPVERRPAEELTYFDRWDNTAPPALPPRS